VFAGGNHRESIAECRPEQAQRSSGRSAMTAGTALHLFRPTADPRWLPELRCACSGLRLNDLHPQNRHNKHVCRQTSQLSDRSYNGPERHSGRAASSFHIVRAARWVFGSTAPTGIDSTSKIFWRESAVFARTAKFDFAFPLKAKFRKVRRASSRAGKGNSGCTSTTQQFVDPPNRHDRQATGFGASKIERRSSFERA
jgi:hypothetical protein